MSDIVERLRGFVTAAGHPDGYKPAVCRDAADEIERLRGAMWRIIAVSRDLDHPGFDDVIRLATGALNSAVAVPPADQPSEK